MEPSTPSFLTTSFQLLSCVTIIHLHSLILSSFLAQYKKENKNQVAITCHGNMVEIDKGLGATTVIRASMLIIPPFNVKNIAIHLTKLFHFSCKSMDANESVKARKNWVMIIKII